jgi:hypothetical protein
MVKAGQKNRRGKIPSLSRKVYVPQVITEASTLYNRNLPRENPPQSLARHSPPSSRTPPFPILKAAIAAIAAIAANFP